MEQKKWNLKGNAIIKNVDLVLRTKNIDKLSNTAYKFIMNISGFIAHYDLQGFMHEYQDVNDLERDIKNSMDTNRPEYYTEDKYFSEGVQSEYYAEKARVLTHFKTM